MSKYDFEIDLSENTSTGIILGEIKKGSSVLEFGCATGRMTRYMKEELDCRVFIVEYEESAYLRAREFAVDGICGDIMDYRWLEKFGSISFDAVIFADVLEHLPDPVTVFEKAASLLAEEGKLLVSVPNITHNDILLKACRDRFDYTPTGILDDTHLHFWGAENIASMAGNSGLTLARLEGTFCRAGDTEQKVETGMQPLLENLLNERPWGSAYQFVGVFCRGGAAEGRLPKWTPSVRSHVYYDFGSGFNGRDFSAADAYLTEKGSYSVSFAVGDVSKLKALRFDPIEAQNCILVSAELSDGAKTLAPVSVPFGLELSVGLLVDSDDPLAVFDLENVTGEDFVLRAEFYLVGSAYVSGLKEDAAQKLEKIAELQAEIKNEISRRVLALEEKDRRMAEAENRFTEEKRRLSLEIQELQRNRRALEEEKQRLIVITEELRRDVCSYILLANNKEKRVISLEQAVAEKDIRLSELEQTLSAWAPVVHRYERIRGMIPNFAVRFGRWLLRVRRDIKGRKG